MTPWNILPVPPQVKKLPGFDYKYRWTGNSEKEHEDLGHIRYILDWGSGFYELYMDARSGYGFTIGPKIGGHFLCLTAEEKSCELADLSDLFWNHERLSQILSAPDAAAIAHALFEFSKSVAPQA